MGYDVKFLNYIMPSIKGVKMLLSSDDELKWKHGSSFEYYGLFGRLYNL